MGIFNITNRYAKALMNLSIELNKFEPVSADVELIYNTLKNSRDLQVALSSPVISSEKKASILNDLFGDKTDKMTSDFIKLIIEKNREDLLFPITKHYMELRSEKLGIVEAQVYSSVDLPEEQKMKLKNKLEVYTGKKVKINFSLDKSLIGGFLVKVNDTILDASLKHQLEALKENFIKGNISFS